MRVAIVGGGIIGLSIAYELSKRKIETVVIDVENFTGTATSASAGFLDPLTLTHYPFWFEHGLQSLALYNEFIRDVETISGVSTGFHQTGMVHFHKRLSDFENFYSSLNLSGIVLEEWDEQGFHSREPLIHSEPAISVFCPQIAQVEPDRLHTALRNACCKSGVEFIGQHAEEFLLSDNTIIAIKTKTQTFEADAFVLATGAWSAKFLNQLQIKTPVIYPVKGHVLTVRTTHRPNHILDDAEKGLYLIPRSNDHLLIGATLEPEAKFNTDIDNDKIQNLKNLATKWIPELKNAKIINSRIGLRPGNQCEPVVGFVPEYKNLQIATGHYRHGILLAPITAQIIVNNFK